MNNIKRLDTIREKIKVSTLLSDHEKSDWLNLLELMNDKQLGELEAILAAEAPAPAPVQTAPFKPPIQSVVKQAPVPASAPLAQQISPQPQPKPQSAPSGVPPLSHIANIPSSVSSGQAGAASKKSSIVQRPSTAPAQTIPQQPANYAPATAAAPNSSAAKAVFAIKDIEQLQEISVDTIRSFELQSVVNIIRDAIVENGYFHVLELIEASPLYKSYIESGKQLLQNQQSILTQAEFEFVTDLLTHMRFNRV